MAKDYSEDQLIQTFARATLIITIRDVLWQELPESYSEESINHYRDTIYNYVSQRYGGVA